MLLVDDTGSFDKSVTRGVLVFSVFIAEIWIDNVIDVVRVNKRIMCVKLVIVKHIVNIVSGYAP